MIPNLKQKLSQLPKVQIQKEAGESVFDYDCSTFINIFDIDKSANEYDISIFSRCNLLYLQKACKIENTINIKEDEIVFFDTETTGLSGGTGTVAFLVGVGRIIDDKFVVKQFLMNDYHQETSLLNELANSLKGAKALVTYNGKSFDAPLIKTRSILNRIELELDRFIHLDLLHACRRIYSKRLDGCKLVDIEEHILDKKRMNDINGSEIPELFFRYLKYRDKSLLDKVIEHNLYDILSLVQISGILANSFEKPNNIEYLQDKYGVAKTLYALGDIKEAMAIFYAIKEEYVFAKNDLAYIFKRNQQHEDALKLFYELTLINRFSFKYDIEIAKIAEHKLKNYKLALKYSNIALSKINNNRLLGIEFGIIGNIENRIKRILAKLERNK